MKRCVALGLLSARSAPCLTLLICWALCSRGRSEVELMESVRGPSAATVHLREAPGVSWIAQWMEGQDSAVPR